MPRADRPRCTVADVLAAVEALAPPRLAEPWDAIGLQAGDPTQPVRRVMTCLELTLPTLAEAVRRRADVVVAHHPLIFKPLSAVRVDEPSGRLLAGLLQRRLALIAAHTNLDAAPWGTAHALAEALGLEGRRAPLAPRPVAARYKFVVFVPEGYERAVIDAIDRGGGGRIGAYRRCTFRVSGVGTFEGDETTHPAIGQAGRFEQAEEWRLEALVPESARASVLAAVRAVHPYEEMAYDWYPLVPEGGEGGLGLLVALSPPAAPPALLDRIRARLHPPSIRCAGPPKRSIRRLAIVPGAGGSVLAQAAAAGADALLTGEIDYHRAVEAQARGLTVIEIGHFESERPVVAPLAARLAADPRLEAAGVRVFAAQRDGQPFRYG